VIDTALHYSGGKDSRAILHMYKDRLKEILVVWVDTNAPYPEVRAEMQGMSRKVPHFLIVKSDQPKQIAEHGYPSDIVPVIHSRLGRAFRKSDIKIQSTFECCADNLWRPMADAMKMLGIKKIIRGQRDSDEFQNPLFKHGMVLDGIECVAPLQDWTESEVFDYLEEHGIELPSYYNSEKTGRDCWNCTGYLHHNVQRIKNLPPEQYDEVIKRLRYIDDAIYAAAPQLESFA
jgi:3'-phosphoadenosine 5'-phosphosulfate sulfotransferase (PAPS reductase)/FAD synthetase